MQVLLMFISILHLLASYLHLRCLEFSKVNLRLGHLVADQLATYWQSILSKAVSLQVSRVLNFLPVFAFAEQQVAVLLNLVKLLLPVSVLQSSQFVV